MSTATCPICAEGTLSAFRVGRTPMLRCDRCQAVVTPPESRATAKTQYYEGEYTLTHTVRADTEMHRYFRYPEYARLISEVLSTGTDHGTWLDIGCDHGFFLDDVRRYGFTVLGVEPSVSARGYARSIGLPVVASISEIDQPCDVISMWHVLEHIDEPLAFLTDLHGRLKANGLLCVRVPDASGFWSRLLADRWIWFQPHHHVVHYTPTLLRSVVERAGFSVLELRQQRPNDWLTRAAYRLSARVFSRTLGRATPSLRDRLARAYQDLTGQELLLIARKS